MPDALFWEDRWQTGQTGWDLGAVSPPLAAYIDQWNNPDAAVLLPGAGNAYEADYLLEKGFSDITVVDVAPSAIEGLRRRLDAARPDWPSRLRLIAGDFFELEGAFDLVLEQTFFCALDPALRERYVQTMHARLRPGGTLAGVLFDRAFEGGPPFGGSTAEYAERFAPLFYVKTLAPCRNSAAPRAGSEVFIIAKRLDA